MTKIVPIVLTPYQNKIFNSQARVSLVTGAAASGTTYGLLHKAFKQAFEGDLVTYINATSINQSKLGGVFECAVGLANEFNSRVSKVSRIISTLDAGKIKFIGADQPLEQSYGVSNQLVILEHVDNEEVIQYHLMRSKQVMIAINFYHILQSNKDHWLQKFGIVETDSSGKPCKIADWVEHITCEFGDGYPFDGYGDYIKHFDSSNPDIQKLKLTSF